MAAKEDKVKGMVPLEVDGKGLIIAIVKTRWNAPVIDALSNGCKDELARLGVDSITEVEVPGAFELPHAVRKLARTGRYDAVVAIGCLIKGETMHFEYIADAVSHGLMKAGQVKVADDRELDVPVVFGVLTVLTEEQALKRAGVGEGSHNHGVDWAQTAIHMATLKV